MSVRQRNNVKVAGSGSSTMVFGHGFGCDQNMWRLLMPYFSDRFRMVVFDHVGSGNSDLSAYQKAKYASLHGYADDLVEVLDECGEGPVHFVGHSVSAMIGMLANIKAPRLFATQIMVGPSPCYINDSGYVGGFERSDIDSLLASLESNYFGWSSTMAPVIMGTPSMPELGEELANSFCRTDPAIAQHFARVTFLSDHRADLPKLTAPTLILQCTEDIIAPPEVGLYLSKAIPNSTLVIIDNVGHCPHLSAPAASSAAIDEFLQGATV
jgi:sigma-B regulation protein RsbQ